MKKWFKSLIADEDGQGMVEYGLLVGLIAIVVIAALVLLGPKIRDFFFKANEALTNATTTVS
ncbi:MAG: Flp family type IVb pilin [Clostridia bacterium]|nr:Flp family type IVb pilin [Clostridia bacterium]